MKLSRRSFLAQSASGIAAGLGVPTFAANALPEISGRAFAANVGTPNPAAMPDALCAKKERRDNFITDPPFLSIPFILFQIVVE